jgi:hypothetical protein
LSDASGRADAPDTRTREITPDGAARAERLIEAAEIQALLDDVFDQGIVHHGYVDYMRDYEVILYCAADPRTGISPEHVRLLFTHCVAADAETAVPAEVWSKSMDDRLLDGTIDHADGYVWGVRWQAMYPGARVVGDSPRAARWSQALRRRFHEVRIETNGHHLNLVFAELQSAVVPPGYAPFVVGDSGPDFKIPL